MSIDKHTPGPWICIDSPSGQGEIRTQDEYFIIATVHINDEDTDEEQSFPIRSFAIANAELIASAPSLKEEVERVTALWGEECRIKKANEAAMNELIGRSITERDALKEENERLKAAIKVDSEETNDLLAEFHELLSNPAVLPIRSDLRHKLDKLINKKKMKTPYEGIPIKDGVYQLGQLSISGYGRVHKPDSEELYEDMPVKMDSKTFTECFKFVSARTHPISGFNANVINNEITHIY